MSTHTLHVALEGNKLRLDVYLAQNLPSASSRSFIKKLIDAKQIQVNTKIAKANQKLKEGDTIAVTIPEDFLVPDNIEPENIPLDIFYEDDCLIIIHKPAGMLVHPATGIYSGTLVNALLYHFQELSTINSEFRPGIVHRLDQETSGLMVVAKNNKIHLKLAKQFERHEVIKRYVALVEGRVEFDQGVIDAPIGRNPSQREKKAVLFDDAAKEAVTFYEVLRRHKGISLVALFPQTGRTHQLRVHMAHLGHPILGDEKYGKKSLFPRLALHAQSLGFTHPETKQYVEFCSIVPREFLSKIGMIS